MDTVHLSRKMILKGILDSEDAKRPVQTNIDGILVSNHGGRQLDSVTSTIRALPKVVDAVQGKVPVFMDSEFARAWTC